jgi:ribosomal protein S18 acetylase RimI-like enzyme
MSETIIGDQPTPELDLSQIVPGDASFSVRAIGPADRAWVDRLLHRYWASTMVYTRGRVLDASQLPGFAAFRDDEPIGLVTYDISGNACEIVTHNSLAGVGGIGSCLLAAVRQEARRQGCKRLWLMVKNDNTPALHFYQRRDFDITAFFRDSVREGRKLKHDIPERGHGGILIRHEFELEFKL